MNSINHNANIINVDITFQLYFVSTKVITFISTVLHTIQIVSKQLY